MFPDGDTVYSDRGQAVPGREQRITRFQFTPRAVYLAVIGKLWCLTTILTDRLGAERLLYRYVGQDRDKPGRGPSIGG